MTQTNPDNIDVPDNEAIAVLQTQRRATYVWVLVVGIVVIALDQLTKSWAVAALSDGTVIEVVWTLQFKLAFNTGMAFSAGSGSGKFIGLGAVIIVAVLMWMAKDARSTYHRILIGVVAGGALGNVVDRLFRDPKGGDGFMSGAVVDFIDMQWWPIFNIADSAIVVGGILLAISGLFWSEPDDKDNAVLPGTSDQHQRVALPGELHEETQSTQPRD